MSGPRTSRRTLLAGAASAALAALVSCSSDDGAAAPTSGPTTSGPTRTSGAPSTTAGTTTTSTAATTSPAPTAAPASTEPTTTLAPTPAPYVPGTDATWETVAPAEAGWSPDGVAALVDFVGRSNSRTLVLLSGGRIMSETYWAGADATTTQDIASCQKSIVSSLVGIAIDRGMLTLEDPISIYLDTGWSNAAPEDEQQITVLHLLTMTSGLHPRTLRKVARPGATWDYNTDAYQKLRPVLEIATEMDIDTLTRQWLFDPIGVSAASHWKVRAQAPPDATGAVPWGLEMTARDMARYGLLVGRTGVWGTPRVVPPAWVQEALAPIPQKADYGYLWWLIGKGHLSRDGAPPDAVAALGAMDQKIYVVPSVDLVLARQGLAAGEASETESDFDAALVKALVAARA